MLLGPWLMNLKHKKNKIARYDNIALVTQQIYRHGVTCDAHWASECIEI